jgi:hypothetical protein
MRPYLCSGHAVCLAESPSVRAHFSSDGPPVFSLHWLVLSALLSHEEWLALLFAIQEVVLLVHP